MGIEQNAEKRRWGGKTSKNCCISWWTYGIITMYENFDLCVKEREACTIFKGPICGNEYQRLCLI